MFNYTENLHWGPHPNKTLFFLTLFKNDCKKKLFKIEEVR
jgi:hypothetical protein